MNLNTINNETKQLNPNFQINVWPPFMKFFMLCYEILKIYRQKPQGFFKSLLGSHYLSETAYDLSHELFEFLKSPYLSQNFPIVNDSSEIHSNMMGLHVCLLLTRMKTEGTKTAINEANNFFFYCKTAHFVDFAEHINSDIPAEDFNSFYVENYANRVHQIEGQLEKHFSKPHANQEELNLLLRKIILMNYFRADHPFCSKLTKYYLAHRALLSKSTYIDLATKKINWGLLEDPKLLQEKQQDI